MSRRGGEARSTPAVTVGLAPTDPQARQPSPSEGRRGRGHALPSFATLAATIGVRGVVEGDVESRKADSIEAQLDVFPTIAAAVADAAAG